VLEALNNHTITLVAGTILAVLVLALILVLYRTKQYAEARVRTATDDLRALNDFHRVLLSDLNLTPVLRRIVQSLVPNMGFRTATIYLFNPRRGALQGEVGHTAQGKTTVSNVSLPMTTPGHLQAALFAPQQGLETEGLVALPIIGQTPEGANALCWIEPEKRCTVLPAATRDTRLQRCLGCANFAPLGVLEVTFGKKPPAVARLGDYAQVSALAVKNAQMLRQAQLERKRAERQLDQLALIHAAGREMTRSLEIESILSGMAQGLVERLGYARVSVALVEGGMIRGHMTFVDNELHWTRDITKIHFPIATHQDPFARVARSGEPLVIRDAAVDPTLPQSVRAEARTIGYAPITAVNERGERNVLGVIAVDHDNPERDIATADLEVISTLGSQVGVALQNAREFETLREREREARALAAFNQTLSARFGGTSADAAGLESDWLDALCDAAAVYAGARFAMITRFETLGEHVTTRTISASQEARNHTDYMQTSIHDRQTLTAQVLHDRKPLHVPFASQDPRTQKEHAAFGETSLLALPIISGGLGLGALIFGRNERWMLRDTEKLERVAQQLALALENAELDRSLHSERERLADVIENMADGVILLEGALGEEAGWVGTGRANARARALLGLREQFELHDLPAQLKATLERGQTSLVVGETRLQVVVTRRHDRSIIVLQDLENFQAIEQAKAELLSVVSHELRTPLTAIIGFVDLLLSGSAGPLTPDQSNFLLTTMDQSRNLHQTVLNLLNASTLEAGLFELNTKPVKLTFKATLDRYSRLTAEKGLQFESSVAEVPKLNVDGTRLELVVSNLLSNALRYTPPGGKVKFSLTMEGKNLHIIVSDTGPGLSPEQLEKLFQRFARGQGNRESLEGAGLSLYVSRAIISAHGGRIWAQSALGEGTTMHITLPLVPEVAPRNPN
jgi:signal transduction histidine kinase